MIKGKLKSNTLEKDDILSKITTYDIYRFYQGDFTVNDVTTNYHRGEKNPSLIISSRLSYQLKHKDFGDKSWCGDCFNFVQQIHNCDFPTALKIIDRDFGLGLTDGKVKSERKIITWEQPEIEAKRPPLFQVIYYANMSKQALEYWKRFGVGATQLKKEHIYQPAEIWRNRKKIPMGNLMTFAYHYPDIDKWKIYRPFAPKRDEKTPINQWKWDTNMPFDYCDGLADIKGCKFGYLTKSKKDKMVLKNALKVDCVADVQAEDAGCLSDETITTFKENTETAVVIFDSDKKGKEASHVLTDLHDFKHCNVPDIYLKEGINDFAGLAEKYGLNKVREHFESKNLTNS